MKTIDALVRSILVGVILATAGCATAPAVTTRAATSTVPQDGSGRIVFYRPSGLFGYGMRPDIFLDGKKVGESTPGSQFHVPVAPGTHYVSVPNSVYSGDRRLEVKVGNKEIVYVRTSLGGSAFGGRTNVELIGASEGASESEGLDLAGS